MAFARDWNESTPTNETVGHQIDDYNRYLRGDVSDRLKEMFYGFIAGENSYNAHSKFMQFRNQASVTTPGANFGRLYTKQAPSIAELHYQGDDGNEKQITKAGKLNVVAAELSALAVMLTGNQTVAGVKTFSSVPKSSANATATGELVRRDQVDGSTVQFNGSHQLEVKDGGVSFAKLASAGVRMATGSYTGNGATDRSITGVGFQPDIVILIDLTNGSTYGWGIKTAAMTGEYSHYGAGGYATELINSLDADGFTLGTSASWVNNVDGRTYNWIAIDIK